MSTWPAVVETIKQTRPNLGRILERKAKLVEFDAENNYIKMHIPAGGLREPKEILVDVASELKNLANKEWKVELPLATEIDINLQTLHQTNLQEKENIIIKAKENPTIKKILQDLGDAEVVDVILNN